MAFLVSAGYNHMVISPFFVLTLVNQMTKKLSVLLILFSTSMAAHASNLTVLQKSLKDWAPISISDKKGVIEIVMNEDRMTPQIYNAVINMGVCPPLWFDAKGSSYLKNTKEVRVLNRHSHSGFVLESPKTSCDEAGKATGDNGTIVINSHTHSF